MDQRNVQGLTSCQYLNQHMQQRWLLAGQMAIRFACIHNFTQPAQTSPLKDKALTLGVILQQGWVFARIWHYRVHQIGVTFQHAVT